jgi:L-Ala-D/L-Glu epimerase
MQLNCTSESWPIAGTFTIARGSKTAADVVVVTLSRNGKTGHGECVPYARYHETVPQVLAALQTAREAIENLSSADDIASLPLPYAARNALDCALWDLLCKELGVTAWTLAGLPEPQPLTTAYTLSLDTPEAMAAAAKAATGRTLLKLKLGRPGDVERLAAIRAAVPQARLIVDANEGWLPDNLPAMLAACDTYGVELVEQPLPAGDDEALRGLPRTTIICADESAHGVASLERLKGKYDAVNIKLDKTGGLTPALQMATAAKAEGFKVMVGCMLATSLAMAPAFLVAQLADYVDLDGPLLLAKDREPAITYNGSLMLPPPRALWG